MDSEDFVQKRWGLKGEIYEGHGDWSWSRVPNGGAVPGTMIRHIPQVDDLWDRFGPPAGRYFAPQGVPYERRSLPPQNLNMGYYQYRWINPWDEKVGEIYASAASEAFEQPGMGIQFQVEKSAQWLVDNGYLQWVNK